MNNRQLKLPLETEIFIPKKDKVRLLSDVIDNLDITCVNRPYSYNGRPLKHSTSLLLKILIFGYMNNLFSSREIANACKYDIRFMWLLDGTSAPSHNIINKFRKNVSGIDVLLSEISKYLFNKNEITFNEVFIDGTKIEANANKYTFVWKKAVNKFEAKLDEKITTLLNECATELCVFTDTIDSLVSILEEQVKDIEFKSGKGSRKTVLQKCYEKAIEYRDKKTEYVKYNKIFGVRNSFSKTDHDATFMRMKEDHMRNGQLKPGYNLQIAVNSEYIVGMYCSSDRNDTTTLIPMLNSLEKHYSQKFSNIVADSGYESEENYIYLQNNGYTSYIKPQNYEISRTRKFKQNISKRENMQYNTDEDYYTCANNKKLIFSHTSERKSKNGYIQKIKNYECENCEDCPHKTLCSKSKTNRKLQVATLFNEKRAKSLANILTDKGVELRMNRSIQVEGAFGVIKQNYGFKRFLTRGNRNVETEFTLLAIAFNFNKLHAKTKNNRNCTFLHKLTA